MCLKILINTFEMKEKNEKKVKIISFAKKEEPSHHFGQIENGQMGQLEEVRPKVVHLKKGQSEVGQIENGQTSDRHQGVIIPKLFGQIKTCPNKIYQSKGGQSEDKRTEIEVGQIDKRKLDKLQKEVAKPTLFGQIQDGHNAIYRSEARQIEENENGQLVKGQSEIGHLGRCLPELKVVLKRLCFLSCSGKLISLICFCVVVVKLISIFLKNSCYLMKRQFHW